MARAQEIETGGFYVYQLIDPRNGLPFYVGKGQNKRTWQHEKYFLAGRPSGGERKNAKIAEIVSAGLSVEVEIVRRFASEVDALDLEYLMVEENPTLTNIQQGGAGLSPLQIELRARRRKEAYLRKRAEMVDRLYEERRQKLHAYRGADRHKEEIDAWVDTVKAESAGTVQVPI